MVLKGLKYLHSELSLVYLKRNSIHVYADHRCRGTSVGLRCKSIVMLRYNILGEY